jgi:hypothetical protein
MTFLRANYIVSTRFYNRTGLHDSRGKFNVPLGLINIRVLYMIYQLPTSTQLCNKIGLPHMIFSPIFYNIPDTTYTAFFDGKISPNPSI